MKGKEIKKLSFQDFLDQGYLQEVNRQFFHPLGLALEVIINNGIVESLGGIWDYRDDPEGMAFGNLTKQSSIDKALSVDEQKQKVAKGRFKQFGFIIQPINSKV